MKPYKFILGAVSMGFASLLITAGAGAKALHPYSYRVVIPADSSSCSGAAQDLAKKFAAATSAQEVTGVCQAQQTFNDLGQSYQQYAVVINYRASAQLVPFQTILGGIDFEGGPTVSGGLYKTYQKCLSARIEQLNYFAKYSGLTAVDSHCESGNRLTNARWSLVIDGFGRPKAYLYGFKPFQNSFDSFDSPAADIIQIANKLIQKYGGEVVYSNDQFSFYYSAYGEQISTQSGPFFNELSQCRSQLSEASTIFNTLKGADVGVICHQDNPGQYQIVAVGKYADQVDENVDANTIKYATFGECMSDRTRVEQNLTSNGITFYGTLCSPSEVNLSGYRMHVYSSLLSE